jgi:hypothetical protein
VARKSQIKIQDFWHEPQNPNPNLKINPIKSNAKSKRLTLPVRSYLKNKSEFRIRAWTSKNSNLNLKKNPYVYKLPKNQIRV